MAFNPDAYLAKASNPSSFDPDAYLASQASQTPQEDLGMLKSGAMGLMSGLPGAETAIAGVKSALGPETYDVEHQKLEDLKDKAWEQHPVAYGTGKTAGMVGTGVVAPEGLAGMALTGAGYGIDAAKKVTDIPKEALIGGGTGAVFGTAVNKVLEPLLGTAASSLESSAKGGLAALGKKTSLSDIEKYLQNPDIVNSAMSKEQIATKLANLTNDIGRASGHLSEAARNELSSTTSPLLSYPKGAENLSDNLKQLFQDEASKYLTNGVPATAADEIAIKTLEGQYGRLAEIAKANNGQIPEDVLRGVIDRIQASTKASVYGNPEAGAAQGALKDVGGKLNSVLRETNPTYAEKMAPSAEAADLSSKLQDLFGIEKGIPTDKTFGKVGNLLKEGKPEEMTLAQKLKDLTGIDILTELQNAQTKENFGAEGPGGALKLLMTGLGFGAGHMTGIPGGGIGGAAIGRYTAESIDGGHLAGRILDGYLNMKNFSADAGITKALQTYGPMLINAAKQGGNNLAATHFVLATSHPEYQKVMDHFQGQVAE